MTETVCGQGPGGVLGWSVHPLLFVGKYLVECWDGVYTLFCLWASTWWSAGMECTPSSVCGQGPGGVLGWSVHPLLFVGKDLVECRDGVYTLFCLWARTWWSARMECTPSSVCGQGPGGVLGWSVHSLLFVGKDLVECWDGVYTLFCLWARTWWSARIECTPSSVCGQGPGGVLGWSVHPLLFVGKDLVEC